MGLSPHLFTEDLPRAMAFYRDALGFEVEATFPEEGAPGWCSLALGGANVMIGSFPPEGPSHPLGEELASRLGSKGPITLYVQVEDADGHHDRAAAAGARVVEELHDTFYGLREYSVEDPDGNLLSFYHPLEAAQG